MKTNALTLTTARAVALAIVASLMLAGCTTRATAESNESGSAGTVAAELRLGYLANITHAPALVGVDRGIIARDLGETKLSTEVFNAGPAEIEALSAGAIDAAYVGPSPAIKSYIQSRGASLRVISGAAIGGAELVVRPGITKVSQLKGTTLATPQLGNTQDTALRYFLKTRGLTSSLTGAGDVAITPTDNANTLALFKSGQIDGAWLPETWASRLVLEAHGHVLVSEESLWPHGTFPTTVLVVNAAYLRAHPATVEALVRGNLEAIDWINANPIIAPGVINAALDKAVGAPLAPGVLARSLSTVTFTVDPIAASTKTLLAHSVAVGTGRTGTTRGLYALGSLNRLLTESGKATVVDDESAAGGSR